MSEYDELLDDLDVWAMVQPRAAKAIRALIEERDTLAAEVEEQARLLAMGGEREAKLMRERDEALRLIRYSLATLAGGE